MPLPHPPVSILPITLVPPWQGHSTVSEPQLPGLSLPCCVRGEPDIGEAVGFGKLPPVTLGLPSWPGCWLTAPLTHGSDSVPGGSLHPRPHVDRPAGLQGVDISG